MILEVRVKPGSSQEKIEFDGKVLTVWLREKPHEGKATVALLKLLKRRFGDAKLISGVTSRMKRVEIQQNSIEEVQGIIDEHPD